MRFSSRSFDTGAFCSSTNSQRGVCECHTSVCPTTVMPCAAPNATSRSGTAHCHSPSRGSSGPHFIMLVGVMALNSRATSCASGVDGAAVDGGANQEVVLEDLLQAGLLERAVKGLRPGVRQADEAGGGDGGELAATQRRHQWTFPAAFSSTTFDTTAVSRVSGRCEQKPIPT